MIGVDVAIRADFVQSVVASGHVEAPFRVNVGSQITGVVADFPVVEGQSVGAGDTLIALDDREARAAVVQAEGSVAQAEARMRQLRELTLPSSEESLAQAQATLVNTQATYDRTAQLMGQVSEVGLVSTNDLTFNDWAIIGPELKQNPASRARLAPKDSRCLYHEHEFPSAIQLPFLDWGFIPNPENGVGKHIRCLHL